MYSTIRSCTRIELKQTYTRCTFSRGSVSEIIQTMNNRPWITLEKLVLLWCKILFVSSQSAGLFASILKLTNKKKKCKIIHGNLFFCSRKNKFKKNTAHAVTPLLWKFGFKEGCIRNIGCICWFFFYTQR